MVNLFSNKSQMMSKCGKNQEKWHTYGNKEFICFISFKKQNVVDGDIYLHVYPPTDHSCR